MSIVYMIYLDRPRPAPSTIDKHQHLHIFWSNRFVVPVSSNRSTNPNRSTNHKGENLLFCMI